MNSNNVKITAIYCEDEYNVEDLIDLFIERHKLTMHDTADADETAEDYHHAAHEVGKLYLIKSEPTPMRRAAAFFDRYGDYLD